MGQLLNDVPEQALRIDWQCCGRAGQPVLPLMAWHWQRAAGGAAAHQITFEGGAQVELLLTTATLTWARWTASFGKP